MIVYLTAKEGTYGPSNKLPPTDKPVPPIQEKSKEKTTSEKQGRTYTKSDSKKEDKSVANFAARLFDTIVEDVVNTIHYFQGTTLDYIQKEKNNDQLNELQKDVLSLWGSHSPIEDVDTKVKEMRTRIDELKNAPGIEQKDWRKLDHHLEDIENLMLTNKCSELNDALAVLARRVEKEGVDIDMKQLEDFYWGDVDDPDYTIKRSKLIINVLGNQLVDAKKASWPALINYLKEAGGGGFIKLNLEKVMINEEYSDLKMLYERALNAHNELVRANKELIAKQKL